MAFQKHKEGRYPIALDHVETMKAPRSPHCLPMVPADRFRRSLNRFASRFFYPLL
jgi:hypothetical protein